ncbi:DUF4189 domain-containing protein [Lysobacter sp. Root690]|uniref:DUF4189 domain-containing protein n=1 Tax=Lysobacter sp. Root690 TaxID=1736588 RepID=UPI0009E8DEEA|nr:DUF4189 domain-containing protein [Lysobacter sp. Root690]
MKLGFVVFLATIGSVAVAQSCPNGIPSAGNPGCIPPSQSNSPYYQSGSSASAAPAARWADRWGAIALDDRDNGIGLGVAQMAGSERKAKRTALDDCRAKGGLSCKVILAYYNQCGVVVAGDSGLNSTSAASVDEAAKRGFEKCEGDGFKGCKVYYSNCSYPVWIR